ncbi:MAG: hypothetical protein SFU21_04335 [Flavihumibacter sp.]|nr:hypothetical protein [Flavihumibacter sp.]
MRRHSFSLVMLLLIITGCSKNSNTTTADCGGTTKSYAADVSPLLQTSCNANAGCHGSGSTRGPGELITYTQVFNARTLIRTSVANGSMPQNSTLTTAQKNTILCWIDNGASNN